MVRYDEAERRVRELVENTTQFTFDSEKYAPEIVGKPTSGVGEPKTDIYVKARDANNNTRELLV